MMADKSGKTDFLKIGYESYCRETGGVSPVTGDQLPPWEELPEEVRAAWTAATYDIVNTTIQATATMIAEIVVECFLEQYCSEEKDA